MTESIVCRTERANPAQSIVAFAKVFVKIYFFVNEDLLANKLKGEI